MEGMTVPELVEAVKTAYSQILHDPLVDVDLTDFQKPFFVVSGQVTKPGQYDLRSDTTIFGGHCDRRRSAAHGKNAGAFLSANLAWVSRSEEDQSESHAER